MKESDKFERIGEIFLTINGKITFFCTLCENTYESYTSYASHLENGHDLWESGKEIKEEIPWMNNGFQEDDKSKVLEEFEIEANELREQSLLVIEAAQQCEDKKEHLTLQISRTEEYTDEELITEFEVEEAKDDVEYDSEKKLTIPKPNIRPVRQRIVIKDDNYERTYKCNFSECNFACKLYRNLLGHKLRHSEHKPHKCTECNKNFFTSVELRIHIRSHTGERPYLCNECGKGFVTSSLLATHAKRHKGIRNFQCEICDRKFFDARTLKIHSSVHSLERLHKCKMCNAEFKRTTSLKNHYKIHENKLEYKCKLCDARFNQGPGLHSHMKSRHPNALN